MRTNWYVYLLGVFLVFAAILAVTRKVETGREAASVGTAAGDVNPSSIPVRGNAIASDRLQQGSSSITAEQEIISSSLTPAFESAMDGEALRDSDDQENVPQPLDSERLMTVGLDQRLLDAFKGEVEWILREMAELTTLRGEDQNDRKNAEDRLAALQYQFDRIRQSIGDDGFDARLYAAALPNRVIVGNGVEESLLANGLVQGDVVASYDGQRVFDRAQLLLLDARGPSDEPVAVMVDRDGELLRLTLPRGSLQGIGNATVSEPPHQ